MKILETTLLLLIKDNEILLAKKKRGFGEGKYNGVGGKLEEGETPEEAMIRETEEEIMITPTKYEKMGVIEFLEYVKGERANVKFHLYVATEWIGIPKESEEMIPKWFSLDNLPYNEMFPDDIYWLPYILEGKKINAFFDFDEEWNLLSYHIKEI
ncbi:MAG: 8-oxo-dGTP diphosphatase [Bacilli bacterium]|jgi:mutator protein MutT|nr:8-oxo-dGTP diphosphatase [Bacilli bacterium]